MKKVHQPDYFLLTLVFFLLIIGLIFLNSASAPLGYKNFKDPYYYLKHQVLNGLIPGLIFFFLFFFINYKSWQKLSSFIFIFSLILLIAVFLPPFKTAGPVRRWLDFKFFSFQPIEFLKFALILFLANFFVKKEKEIKSFSLTFLPFILILGFISFLIILQPNFSGLIMVILIALTIYFVAGGNLIYLFLFLLIICLLLPLFIQKFPYLENRLKAVLYPQIEPKGISYHLQQSLIAIGSGGLFGRGLGLSGQKFFYLPEVFSDSIFSIIAEELGFIGATLIIFLFFLFIFRGLKLAKNSPDLFSQLVIVGIVSWFGFQFFIHLGSMLGILPLTGVPLPLISYGGSAMSMNLAALGLLINISKYIS